MNNAAKATRLTAEPLNPITAEPLASVGVLSIRVLSNNPTHHLPPSPADIRRATAGRDGDGVISIRVLSNNPNHHLWNNNGTWWCHYTIHRADFTKQRVRVSLDTCDPRVARAKRDAILAGRFMLPARG